MADTLTKEQRSAVMARIRGTNTRPERLVRSALHRMGYRFRLHRRDLPGTPDIVLPRHRTAIFVHGCFWHRHPGCPQATTPATRRRFWLLKFERNVARDTTAMRELRRAGWRVVTIWECTLPRRESERAAFERRLVRMIEPR